MNVDEENFKDKLHVEGVIMWECVRQLNAAMTVTEENVMNDEHIKIIAERDLKFVKGLDL